MKAQAKGRVGFCRSFAVNSTIVFACALSQCVCELWKVPCESSPASAGLELTAPFLRADHLRLSGQDGNTYCVRSYGCASAMGQTARFNVQIPGESRVSGGFPPETYSCSFRVCCDGALVPLMVEFLTCFLKKSTICI